MESRRIRSLYRLREAKIIQRRKLLKFIVLGPGHTNGRFHQNVLTFCKCFLCVLVVVFGVRHDKDSVTIRNAAVILDQKEVIGGPYVQLGAAERGADNLVKRHFHANAPNVLRPSDITEFGIPAGKCYLSPILDCFDGKLVSWAISTSLNAEFANGSLELAYGKLSPGEHPVIHTDRGCPYRWPGWISICEANGLVRSASKKVCSPDNSAMEGFFGHLKDTDNGNHAIDEGYRRKCARANAMAH